MRAVDEALAIAQRHESRSEPLAALAAAARAERIPARELVERHKAAERMLLGRMEEEMNATAM